MATIKSHTDISQSKKLAEILSLESADMYWFRNNVEVPHVYPKDMMKDSVSVTCPCWSLAALLNTLPDYTLLTEGGAIYVICESKKPIISNGYNNPIDACYEMILKLHELKML